MEERCTVYCVWPRWGQHFPIGEGSALSDRLQIGMSSQEIEGMETIILGVDEFGDLDTLWEVPCPLAPLWTRAHHSQSIVYTIGPIQGDPSNKKVQLNIWNLNLFSLLLAKQIEWGNDLQFKLLLEGRIPSLLVSILARPGQEKRNLFLKTLRVNHTHIF